MDAWIGTAGTPRPNLRVIRGGARALAGADPRLAAEGAALIVRIAQAADKEAFAALFQSFAPRVKSYMAKLGAPSQQAEELAQETLLTVWRKASYFDPHRASPAAWIFTIARNLRIDALRKESPALAWPDEAAEIAGDEPSPHDNVDAAQRESRVRDAMKHLPAEQIEVVRLSFFQDKAHGEIARDLSLPLGTVKSRLRLAMQRLRGLLDDLT